MNRLVSKILLSCLVLVAVATKSIYANEGMWLPMYIKQLEGKMQSMGSKLTAEDIYSVNHASIKDAIVSFGGYCTGEIVSSKGLLFTNHHCGYESIAALSTTKNNWLKNGFWAKNHAAELPVEGLSIKIMVRMEDITSKMLSEPNKDELEAKLIEEASKEGPGYTAEVKSMFYGNEYYLVVYQEFSDIRLVGTPPENIGKFGGDTDNWMWPRHTGDFSIFRIYADANNNPASYSPNNVPYTPKKHLAVSLGGVKENDFAFIMGFPGQTQRYLTSDQITKIINEDYPLGSSIMDVKLKAMKKFMDADEAIKIQYASNYASYANTWKYFLGNIYSAKHSNFVEVKKDFESELQEWINADPARKEKWGTLINDIAEIQKAELKTNKLQSYVNFAYLGPDFMRYALRFFRLPSMFVDGKKLSPQGQVVVEGIKAGVDEHFAGFNAKVDRQIFIDLSKLIFQNFSEDEIAEVLNTNVKNAKGNNLDEKIEAYADEIFAKSFLVNKAKANKLLKKPTVKALKDDIGMQYFQSVLSLYFKVLQASGNSMQKEDELMKEYMAAVMEYRKKDLLYPDANFTLRLTYGEVLSYNGTDGKNMGYLTNASEILDKESTTNEEFEVFPRLKELIQKKDYGRYAEQGQDLKVNFLTTHDITGGNSGSPVMNKEGALIGIAFDGNWESMVGDLSYQANTQRTISVDIRYVLFIIDKYAGATNIIEELTLVD